MKRKKLFEQPNIIPHALLLPLILFFVKYKMMAIKNVNAVSKNSLIQTILSAYQFEYRNSPVPFGEFYMRHAVNLGC